MLRSMAFVSNHPTIYSLSLPTTSLGWCMNPPGHPFWIYQHIVSIMIPSQDDSRHRLCDSQISTWMGSRVMVCSSHRRYVFKLRHQRYLLTRQTLCTARGNTHSIQDHASPIWKSIGSNGMLSSRIEATAMQ